MTVGMPGAAIGGLFYVVSAVCAPPVALVRWCGRRDARNASELRTALRQSAIGWGIVLVTCGTGWVVTACLQQPHAGALGAGAEAVADAPGRARDALRVLALLSSLGTLVLVMLGVQVTRLLARSTPTPLPEPLNGTRPAALRGRAGWGALVLAATCSAMVPQPARARTPEAFVAAGDSALAAEDFVTARASYDAALKIDAQSSRALFQRARVATSNAEACEWLRRYVAVQPDDAWGWMALGDHAARAGRAAEANAAYERAVQLAPQDRDAWVGLARVQIRTGRTDAAIATYTQWVGRHPGDVEAATELGRAQRRAGQVREAARTLESIAGRDERASAVLNALRGEIAPAFEPFVQGTTDSDDNSRLRWGAASEIALPDGVRAGVVGSRLRVADPTAARTLDVLAVRLAWRPRAALRMDAAPGIARAAAVPAGDALVPAGVPVQNEMVGSARARWQPATGPLALGGAVRREFLDASLALLDARVMRTEGSARIDLPLVSRIAARGGGRWARYDGTTVNNRTQWSGALVVKPRDSNEWSLSVEESHFDHPAVDGYFAPARAQSVELGSYGEFELSSRVSLALDLGAGVEQLTAFGAAAGGWDPVFRGWTQLSIALRPGCALRFEAEADDSQASTDTNTAGEWRYGFAAASLRWALH